MYGIYIPLLDTTHTKTTIVISKGIEEGIKMDFKNILEWRTGEV